MKSEREVAAVLARAILFVACAGPLVAQTFVVFDAPNASETSPQSVNVSGAVAGGSSVGGFVRDPSGNITTFNVPNALYTWASSINDSGAIVGNSYDWSLRGNRGFVRDPSGNITTLDVPNATNTWVSSINDSGAVAGQFFDATHGGPFVRDPSGNITTFDVPNAGIISGYGMNDLGAVVGEFSDLTQNGNHRGFVRDPSGNITTFNVPNATATWAVSITDSGAIVGEFSDATQNDRGRGFVLIDNTPPTTVATASPIPNAYGWNNTDVTISLNATDNPGWSGVKQIQFSLSGAQNMTLQTRTGGTASVTISAEGTTILSYFATDNAGNQEAAKTLTVRIDKTPPNISGTPAPGCSLWPPKGNFVQVATVTAADALSGLTPGSFKLTGTSNEPSNPNNPDIVITPNSSGGYVVQLRADRLATGTGRVYTINATATDLAGNTATVTETCTVPHDQGSN